jgi:glutathione S-transferase
MGPISQDSKDPVKVKANIEEYKKGKFMKMCMLLEKNFCGSKYFFGNGVTVVDLFVAGLLLKVAYNEMFPAGHCL